MSTELSNGVIIPEEYSDDWYDEMSINLRKLNDVITAASDNATDIQRLDTDKANSSDLATVATSGSYTDLTDKPTINDSTITIQKNGSTVDTFTTNGSAKTINIPVPTKTSDLTNDSNFVDTSNAAVSSGITSAKVTDYDTHIADTDIHVTTADKNKWNNQTYVFRYSSTALVASSTNSNALLDNTDNLKVGDKVIDSSGVLFSITAIDTQNSTFTIGTALVDLAQDSDVVHKSGNETISGIKTFDSNTYVYNSDNTATTPSLYLKSSKIEISSQGNTSGDQNLTYLDKNSTAYAFVKGAIQSNGSAVKIRAIAKDSSDNSVINELQMLAYTNGNKAIFPTYSNEIDLGVSSYKWKSFNGVEPSSLSLPSSSGTIDISSYITDLTGGGVNNYTPLANGYIVITCNANDVDYIKMSNNLDFVSVVDNTNNQFTSGILGVWQPCIANIGIQIRIKSSALKTAKFIPCQGNV